jgi:hypothetical protein
MCVLLLGLNGSSFGCYDMNASFGPKRFASMDPPRPTQPRRGSVVKDFSTGDHLNSNPTYLIRIMLFSRLLYNWDDVEVKIKYWFFFSTSVDPIVDFHYRIIKLYNSHITVY